MNPGSKSAARPFRPVAESLEARLVLSATTVNSTVRGLLTRAGGEAPVRPNTPVLPLESGAATATFIDPSVQILNGQRIRISTRDYLAPFAVLDARGGSIQIGSNSTIQDNVTLVANPTRAKGGSGILIGDDVALAAGVTITGPASVGFVAGAATSVGANAVIDHAVIQAGAFVGALARVGPGVTINAGFRVLPGANVTNQAEATDPALGKVVVATPADSATAASLITRNQALASAYTNFYQGVSATGPGTSSSGPVPAALVGGSVFFGALNNVLGVSSEPGSIRASFEPTAATTPTFRSANGTNAPLPQNIAFRFPGRVIGQVVFAEPVGSVRAALGRRDSIRGDEGQAIVFNGPIGSIGSGVTIHSPLGGVRSTTTTTVVTTTTAAGVTTTTTNATTTTSSAAPTATAGMTTATTTGRTPAGVATTGTVTTTVTTTSTQVGIVTVGTNFRAGNNATLLGGPSQITSFGANVTVGNGTVVDTATIGDNVLIGDRAYVARSTIPAGTVIPAGTIIINNVVVGTVQS